MFTAIALHLAVSQAQKAQSPSRTEVIQPIHIDSFNHGGKAKKRKQGGNPRTAGGVLMFDGAMDGNRQVDPQIAVGGGYVLHGTNGGFTIYDKKGNYVDGVPQSEFNDGIDPKMFFDPRNRVFGFDVWAYWNDKKPVNISVSETADPTKAWNTYPVPAPKGADGGAIGHSRKWIGYSFPGGDERTFIMKMDEVKRGKPATVFHFQGSLGAPVKGQDGVDGLYFFDIAGQDFVIRRIDDDGQGVPFVGSTVRVPHGLTNVGGPPQSPMKGVTQRTSSGDRNPKNIVLQNGCIWFSHNVNIDGRSAVQWHQIKLDGTIVQTGVIKDPVDSFIQTTLGVNSKGDVIVGYQETGPEKFISAMAAYRLASDPPGTLRKPYHLAQGVAATEGGAWGDYSGSCVDGDNLSDLWTVQSYANDKGRGSTVIARVTVDGKR